MTEFTLPLEAQPAAVQASGAQVAPGVLPFTFTGSAREYFPIWIVNVFLSVVTLGIYSAWAKVRKKRYLYGNTWVADANFDYHGDPVAILKGRLLAVAALLSYTAAANYLPRLGLAILLALFLAAPWLIVRTFQFNAVNSSYRHLRFGFRGRYHEALRALLPLALSPLLVLALPEFDALNPPRTASDILMYMLPSLPIVLFYPYVVGSVKRLHVDGSSYGTARFGIAAGIGAFYRIYLLAAAILVPAAFVVGMAAAAVVFIPLVGWLGLPLLYLLLLAGMIGFTRARVANLVFNTASLGGRVRFASTLRARGLAKLYFVNLVAITLSLGLLVPWAVIRTARYRASCLRLECDGDVEAFLAATVRPVAAAGEQMGEFFDVDLSL